MTNQKKINVAQIGCGYWGPNLLRNFTAHPNCHVKWVVETNAERRAYVETHFPLSKATPDFKKVLDDKEIDAIVIATPAATHFELAKIALEAGKHVLVEKPLAMTVQQTEELSTSFQKRGRVLMVGHTFLYHPAVRYLKKLIVEGELGHIYYIYSQRLNLGQLRSDINAWFNLAPHDVSILLYLMDGKLPSEVRAHGMDYIQRGIEDVVFAHLVWENKVIANIHVSWLDPDRVRKMTVVGEKKMAIYDDISENKITILDKGIDRIPRVGEQMDYDNFANFQFLQRKGDVWFPKISSEEPLKVEVDHFLGCILNGSEPLTGPKHARDVVAVLEAGQKALKSQCIKNI